MGAAMGFQSAWRPKPCAISVAPTIAPDEIYSANINGTNKAQGRFAPAIKNSRTPLPLLLAMNPIPSVISRYPIVSIPAIFTS